MSHNNISVLVLGAGELGMSILRNLADRTKLKSRAKVSVLLRPATITSADPAKRADLDFLRSEGIGFLEGDLAADSPARLAEWFSGFDTVISCTGFVGGSGTQLKITRAALDAGVKRYVPWQFGVDYDVIGAGSAQDLFDEQLAVRDLLRSQDRTGWVIISTGMFTSFLFEPSFGVVDLEANAVNALGSWDTAVTVTTGEDIGALTVEILFAEPRILNEIVYTAGDTVTYGRLADIVDSVLHRKLQRTEWTVNRLRADLAEDPGNALKKYRVVFAEGKGVSWDPSTTFNRRRGIEVTDVETWAFENLR